MGDYTRLSAFDRCFLDIEDAHTHMHVAATCVFDATPLQRAGGGIDIARIRRHVHGRLNSLPRYRQRIAYTPVEGHPIWVDDFRFDLRYHVRHVSLPRPGDERQLKRTLGWINSRQLDRSRSPWEMWVVEGLEGNRFAVCQKVHHCMIDGIAGAEEMAVMLDASPETPPAIPRRWQPRPLPPATELLRDAVLRRLTAPAQLAYQTVRAVSRSPRDSVEKLRKAATGLASTAAHAMRPSADTPLNRPVGGQRRFDWLAIDIDKVKAIKERLGGTVNDVVLAAVTGGLRGMLVEQGASSAELDDLVFRAMCPVSRRGENGRSTVGNKVAGMLVDLPVGESDVSKRFVRVHDASAASKQSHQSDGTDAIAVLSEWTTPALMRFVQESAPRYGVYNLIVTNIPGPPFPLYMLGARMLETYPLVPLFPNQGLAIALFSYAGTLYWGFNADREIVPDLHAFVRAVEQSLAELADAAGLRERPREPVKAPMGALAEALAEVTREAAVERASAR